MKVKVRKERTVRIDSELWNTSWCLLKAGQEHELGCSHQFRASLVFTAFALEAYLNHIGARLFKSWEKIERKLTPTEKLSLLCEQLQVSIDWSARPWQTVKDLFRFRNTVAHGRGEALVEEYLDSHDRYLKKFYEIPQAVWEKFASQAAAIRAREDVERLAESLHASSGRLQDLPFMPGAQTGSAGPAEGR